MQAVCGVLEGGRVIVEAAVVTVGPHGGGKPLRPQLIDALDDAPADDAAHPLNEAPVRPIRVLALEAHPGLAERNVTHCDEVIERDHDEGTLGNYEEPASDLPYIRAVFTPETLRGRIVDLSDLGPNLACLERLLVWSRSTVP